MKKLIALFLLLASLNVQADAWRDPSAQGAATITSGTINNTTIGVTTPAAGKFTTITGTTLVYSTTAPTIASGFGTSPSVVASNGTAAFTINVGTGGSATGGVVTMPAATTGWSCSVTPNAAPQAAAAMYSAPTSTTSITITNYTLTSGVALAWAASAVIAVRCVGY